MKPGREMDRAVAKHVMGEPFSDVERPHEYPQPCQHCGNWCSDNCHYSTNDDAAWAVVRQMWENGYRVVLSGSVENTKVGFYGERSFACTSTFAFAVCVSALAALGELGAMREMSDES